jgi:hypothetical protein
MWKRSREYRAAPVAVAIFQRRRKWAYAAAAICAGLSAQAGANPPSEAFALADAMQLMESSRLGLEARIQAGIAQGRKSQKELDCFKSADLGAVRVVFAEAFAGAMTIAEMEEGRNFFTTAEGRRYLQYSNAKEMADRGWSTARVSDLSEEELVAAAKFLASPTGNKIYFQVLQSAEVKDKLFERLLPVLAKCVEQKTPAQYFAELALSMPASPSTDSASSSRGARASHSQAVELVRAMREDELAILSLRQRISQQRGPAAKGPATACVEAIQPADITDTIAVSIEEGLSDVETVEAITFYRSEVGKKFTQLSFDSMERATEPMDFIGVIRVEGALELRKFFARPVARKLLLEKITLQQSAMDRLGLRLRELAEKCLQETTRRP